MKITLPVSLLALVISTVLLYNLGYNNSIASDGQKDKSYTYFNHNPPAVSQAVMNYWRADDRRVTAVKNIIKLDYVFMAVYCVFLCFISYRLQRTQSREWLKTWLRIGIGAIILCTLIDALQDWKIYQYISTQLNVSEMRWYTRIKFSALILGIIPIILAILPRPLFQLSYFQTALKFVSRLLKSVWIFFPGFLFLLLTIACFWMAGQGKDIIIAFTQNEARSVSLNSFSWNYTRIIFFVAIGFWVYVSWYSSRIISYIKKTKQDEPAVEIQQAVKVPVNRQGNSYPEISANFLDEMPRIIGNACFLVLELAVLQSPLLTLPISSGIAWVFLIEALLVIYFLNRWIQQTQAQKPGFRKLFYILLFCFLVLVVAICFFKTIYFITLFVLLLIFHCVFIFYINLRRLDLAAKAASANIKAAGQNRNQRSWLEIIMDYFCIPRAESGYFKWFIYIGITGLVFYLLTINWLFFARRIGPFPFIILAFGVLLAFGNIVTSFSVRFKVNFHFLLFLLAFFFGLSETHYVKKTKPESGKNNYDHKPSLSNYLQAWLKKNAPVDSAAPINMYFVMSNGGASRSGYWTAAVLGKIEDTSLKANASKRFSDHIFCLSGTSGGGVGVAGFFSMLRNKDNQPKPLYESSLKAYLQLDYFTYTFARLLGPDFFNYIFHFATADDRAAALEKSFEESSLKHPDSLYRIPFNENLSAFPALNKDNTVSLPVLFVNTTRMQDGNPGVVTNINLDSGLFNNRVDVVKLLADSTDITITSGAILGARFPYLSPAGRIGNNYFVDGGYFDNSGAGVVQEIIRAIINTGKEHRTFNDELYKQISRIHFNVLHIVNSPVELDSSTIRSVAPVKNDLMAPILTILGAYDMQTTVNDMRLINFLHDINSDGGNKAGYTRISLYKDKNEWQQDALSQRFKAEPPYAMNWFMSDTTVRRINNRLLNNNGLEAVIKEVLLENK